MRNRRSNIDFGVPASPLDIARVRTGIMDPQTGADPIRNHLREIGARDMGPDVAGIDVLSFRAGVATTAVVTQPTKQTTAAGFWAELFGIGAWVSEPATDPEAASLISFTVKDGERNGQVFNTDWWVADLFSSTGGNAPLFFERGLYRFDPGSDITIKFTTDADATNGWNARVAAHKWVGVSLYFNLYAVAVEE